ESTPQHTMCLVDEADSKAEESWPYELLLRHLEPPQERRKRVCFILAGSSGRSLEEMTAAIRQRPKGAGRPAQPNSRGSPPRGSVPHRRRQGVSHRRSAPSRGSGAGKVDSRGGEDGGVLCHSQRAARKREATEGFCDQLRETNTSRRGPDQVRRPVHPGRPRAQGCLDPNA